MKALIHIPCLALMLSTSNLAYAQATQMPTPGATTMPAAPGTPPIAVSPNAARAQEARAACRADPTIQSLRGPARKEAMQKCFAEKAPDLAARADCRQQAKAQGTEKGKTMRDFVKSCLAKPPG